MNGSKFTPGPWEWVDSQSDEPFDFESPWDGKGYPSLRTIAVFGENKTEVRDGGTYTSFALPKWILDAEPMQNGNDAANARLIAAAPELLEALESLVRSSAPEHVEAALSAIQKATGEKE